jgi:protochlorophyllide reductase
MQSGDKSAPPTFTSDGFEATVGTNHIGHFLLIQSLISELEKSKDGRVVIVGSGVHNPEEGGGNVGSKATLGDLSGFSDGFRSPVSMVDGGAYDADKAYKDSKLCNVITALELSRRLKSKKFKTSSFVMNPGLIPTTGLFRSLNPIFVTVFAFLTRYIFRVAATEEEGGGRLAYMVILQ